MLRFTPIIACAVMLVGGCRVCSYRTFEVSVRDAETGEPVEDALVADVSGGWKAPFTLMTIGCPATDQQPTWYLTDELGQALIRLPAKGESPLVAVLNPGTPVPNAPRHDYSLMQRPEPGRYSFTMPIRGPGAGYHAVKDVPHGGELELRSAPPRGTPWGAEVDVELPYTVSVRRP